MAKKEKQVTNEELLSAIHAGFTDIDGKINGLEDRLDGVENRLDGVENRLDGVENRLDGVDKRLIKIEATMVTKEYLDDKMSDLRGDLVVLTRKEDKKVVRLVNMLEKKKVLTKKEASEIQAMEPFPELSLHLK